MLINNIVSILVLITGLIFIPVQMVSTFVLGLLVRLTFGLLLLPLSLIWMVVFLGPLIGLSYLYDKVFLLRPIAGVLGIPIAVLGDIYTALIPSMGEMESRCEKMVVCQTFPYTWRYMQYKQNKLTIDLSDPLNGVLKNVCKSKPLNSYLDRLRADVYSRPEYLSGKCGEIGW